ncbi:MAG TPA: hypothetical protein VGG72_06645 [Bryobacteraceae bacterium]|jgi:hypothetical protein
MLWYKGWLETRWKLLMALAMAALFVVVDSFAGAKGPPPPAARAVAGFVQMGASFVVVVYSWLAGAGIVTQPSFQATKGIHGSTLFTLSLPVSRFHLLAVRAGLGWLEMAGAIGLYCWGMWLTLPAAVGLVTAMEMFEYAAALIACASSFYFLSALLATFLDDLWRVWGGMIAYGALWLLSSYVRVPASLNIVRAMIGEASPLRAHKMPWTPMAFSLGLSVILFCGALKIVRAREY